jgi:23S rRNA (cytidine1920-2'-O)/16S rRNA (cytidine1409-2'-O)-methyltransferase
VPVPTRHWKEALLSRKPRVRLWALADLVSQRFPNLDASLAIAGGAILVDGYPVRNPRALVRQDASLRIARWPELRGESKLRAALAAFEVSVADRVAVDLGAAAGGFTRVLVEAGARRVYAVDAGHGQLRGSLRQHPSVVNLEGTNLAELDRSLVPDSVDVLSADLSYLALARALPQVQLAFTADADLLAVVKPQFELGLAGAPDGHDLVRKAGRLAVQGAERAGWTNAHVIESPVTGARGARELLLHASRG